MYQFVKDLQNVCIWGNFLNTTEQNLKTCAYYNEIYMFKSNKKIKFQILSKESNKKIRGS